MWREIAEEQDLLCRFPVESYNIRNPFRSKGKNNTLREKNANVIVNTDNAPAVLSVKANPKPPKQEVKSIQNTAADQAP